MAEAMLVCDWVRRLGLVVGVMALFQIWVVRWVRVCRDGLCNGDCRDGLCDGSVSKGMGCACCKSDGVCDWVCLQEEGVFDGVGLDMGWGGV
ncbi:unnamed protein product [Prunus armeniaca]